MAKAQTQSPLLLDGSDIFYIATDGSLHETYVLNAAWTDFDVTAANWNSCSTLRIGSGTVTRYFLLSLPAIVAAAFIGRAMNQPMRDTRFFRFVYTGLIAVGGILVVQVAIG